MKFRDRAERSHRTRQIDGPPNRPVYTMDVEAHLVPPKTVSQETNYRAARTWRKCFFQGWPECRM